MITYRLDKSERQIFNENYSVSTLQGLVEKYRLYQKDDDAGLVIEDGAVTGIEMSA